MGSPKSVNITKIPNIHFPDQIDEIHELFYDGLSLEIYVVKHPDYSGPDPSLLRGISITSNKYKVKYGLNIGSSKAAVKKVLGNPLTEDHKFTYENTDGYANHVYFYFRNARVYRIDWHFFID